MLRIFAELGGSLSFLKFHYVLIIVLRPLHIGFASSHFINVESDLSAYIAQSQIKVSGRTHQDSDMSISKSQRHRLY